ncbi:MAG: hypothetical protein ACLSH6_07690 [Limosilactobacillus pontis]
MSKKVLLGTILGSVATVAAWKLLPSAKKTALKQRVNATATDFADRTTDYALDALDIVDAKMAESEADEKFSVWSTVSREPRIKLSRLLVTWLIG